MPNYPSSLTTDVLAITKIYYANKQPELTFKNRPLTGFFQKSTDGYGEVFKLPLLVFDGGGQSATFATAKANKQDVTARQLLIEWKEFFTLIDVNNTPITLAGGNKKAIADYLTTRGDSSLNNHANKIEQALFASGYGEIGTIATGGISGAVITLTQRSDTRNFRPGQKFVLAASVSGNTLRNSGATATVLSVQHAAGTVTCTANLTASIAAAAAGDVIFQEGDRQDSATPALRYPAGLKGWIPFTRPTAGDNFYGLDRSIAPDLLAGQYVDARGKTITQAISKLTTRVGEMEGNPDLIVMHNANLEKLILEQQNKIQFTEFKGKDVPISFAGLAYPTSTGVAKIVASPNCDMDRVYALETDTWMLKSAGPLIDNPLQTGKVMDLESGDGAELRNKSIWASGCTIPSHNGVAQVDIPT